MVSEFLRSNNINLVRQCFTNEYHADVRCPHVFVREGHRTSGYSFVHETLANQVYVVATEEL